jgi:peptide deformylase
MPVVMINPRIVEEEGQQSGQEGCLSFPEIFVGVKRAAKVTAAFMNLEGREEKVLAQGLFARAIQHELDHLNGVLLVDRMSPVQKVANAGKLKRLKKQALEK